MQQGPGTGVSNWYSLSRDFLRCGSMGAALAEVATYRKEGDVPRKVEAEDVAHDGKLMMMAQR